MSHKEALGVRPAFDCSTDYCLAPVILSAGRTALLLLSKIDPLKPQFAFVCRQRVLNSPRYGKFAENLRSSTSKSSSIIPIEHILVLLIHCGSAKFRFPNCELY